MIKRFIIYGFIGWGIEIIWTGLSSMLQGDKGLSGFTNLWMFLIYGSAIFLEPIHDIIYGWKWPIRGIIWVVMIWGIEYTSGLILLSVLKIYPWHYSGPYAVDGLVRLDYAPAWFVAGLIFERVHRKLEYYKIV